MLGDSHTTSLQRISNVATTSGSSWWSAQFFLSSVYYNEIVTGTPQLLGEFTSKWFAAYASTQENVTLGCSDGPLQEICDKLADDDAFKSDLVVLSLAAVFNYSWPNSKLVCCSILCLLHMFGCASNHSTSSVDSDSMDKPADGSNGTEPSDSETDQTPSPTDKPADGNNGTEPSDLETDHQTTSPTPASDAATASTFMLLGLVLISISIFISERIWHYD